jgi:site-specific DNA-methyltransferase (adenine-specific)
MQLLHGDCLELMKTLPDKCIDLFICDLPYESTCCSWDKQIDLVLFWEQIERLMKNDNVPIIHFCNARFGFELYNSNPNWFRYQLVWDKTFGVDFLNANRQPLRSHENIHVFAKKSATYYRKDIEGDFKNTNVGSRPKTFHTCKDFGYKEKQSNEGKRCVKSVFQFANKKGKGNHPTQKPLDLYKFLIERYSKEGDTVLDPSAGSFTSALACKELNRNYIGIEMNEEFYKKGIELLQL